MKKYSINEVMSPSEASDRWGLPYETLRSRLSGRTKSMQQDIENSLSDGLVKRYKADGKTRYEWILTKELMEKWYGPEPSKK